MRLKALRMNKKPHPHEVQAETLSSLLASALDANEDGSVSVAEVLDRVAERGFGLILFILGLPNLIPVMPPGSSGVFGALILLTGVQILFGLPRPWLPNRLRQYQLSPKAVQALQNRGVVFMKQIERVSKPRWERLVNPLTLRIVAVPVILLGLVLFSPLPLMNTLPATIIMLMGIGLLNRDGLLLVVGLGLSVLLLVFLVFSFNLLISFMPL
jgi:hypothetical protein